MKTNRWFPLLTLLLALPLAVPAAPVTTLRIMTFNILQNGAGSGGLSQCADAIRDAGADVVGIQEADGYALKNLADQLGWHWTQTGGAGQYGIISRYPIIARVGETTQIYGGIGATIELSADQRVHLFNAHLNYLNYGPYYLKQGRTATFIINNENSTRLPGLNALLGLASPYLGSAEPTFVIGDFNAPSHQDYAALNWPTTIACVNAGLSDSYRALHSGNRTYPSAFAYNEPGITWTPSTGSEPNGVFDRIDFIFNSANDGVVPTAATELDARNSVSPWPSDHRAVVTTFSLAMPAQGAQAGSPLPANGQTGARLRPAITWVPGTGTTSHNVYFGTPSPGTLQGNQSGSKYYPARLSPNTTYYWRIDEVKSGGTTAGNTWSFTTGNFSWADPAKANYAKNETITVNFGNGPGAKADWIGLYAANSAYGPGNVPSIKWLYLNGSQAPPKNGVRNGSITFTGGLSSAGSYRVRFFSNDGFFLLDEAAFAVGP